MIHYPSTMGREAFGSPAPPLLSGEAAATVHPMAHPWPRARRYGAWLVGVAALLAVTGCADSAETSDEEGLTLRLVIPDANIREPDVPCSGASGYRYAHPDAPFTIEDADGHDVASGTLPEGMAEKAFNIDLGDDRQPTVCVMRVDVQGVDTLDDHYLVIDDRSPVPIRPNPSLDDMPEVVLR